MDVTGALAAANDLLAETLTDSVARAPRVDTPDGAGGSVVSFGSESTLAARVHPARGSSADGGPAGAEQDVDRWTVVVDYGSAVQAGDRIRWVDSTGATRTLYVVDVTESSWLIGRYCEAMEAP